MRKSSALAEPHIANSKAAAENLKTILKSSLWKDSDLLEIIPAAAVALLLLEVISCTEKVAEAVRELESLARFRNVKPRVTPANDQPQLLVENQHDLNAGVHHHVITIAE